MEEKLVIKKIEHIGIAVENLEIIDEIFGNRLNLKLSKEEELKEEGVKVVCAQIGETKLEFLQPDRPDSPVGKFLARRGPGVHHLCLKVEDIEEAIQFCLTKGLVMVDERPRKGLGGKRVAFIHPKSTAGILLELSEG